MLMQTLLNVYLACLVVVSLVASAALDSIDSPSYGLANQFDDVDSNGDNTRLYDLYKPVFSVQLATEYFAIKSKPANLTCRARNADSLQLHCNGELVTKNLSVTRIPLAVALAQAAAAAGQLAFELEASALINRNEVVELFAEYQCRCLAVRNLSSVTLPAATDSSKPPVAKAPSLLTAESANAIVREATLGKNFNQEPIDITTESGAPSIVFQCRAPEGDPPPEIYWLRNEKLIDPYVDTNFVVANDGNLILSQAREFDSGNYTCVAQNVAGTRKTQPAQLIVVVHGGWSPWTNWQPCSKKCGPGTQRRSRECSNPRPANDGKPCEGVNEEKRACNGSRCNNVRADEFLEWSDWSDCDKCFQKRRKTICRDDRCTNKTEEVQTQNCCQQPRDEVVDKVEEAKQLILYISTPIAGTIVLLIFGLILLIIFRRMRQRSRIRLYGVTNTDSARCLKLRKNCVSKSSNAESLSNRYDIGMAATAQLINGSDSVDARYSQSNGTSTTTVPESHFQNESHFFCTSRPDAHPSVSAVSFSSTQPDAAGQNATSYFPVPFVGKQQQVATTNLPYRFDQLLMVPSATAHSTATKSSQSNASYPATAIPNALPYAMSTSQYNGPLQSSTSFTNAPKPTFSSAPQSVTLSGTTHPSASAFSAVSNSIPLHDSPEMSIVSVNPTMRLPPSISIPPPPPASARPFVAQSGFKLSLRPSAHGPELTLAGGSCNDTFPHSCESRTDMTFSELSSVHSETDEGEMSELCDAQLQLVRSNDFANTPNGIEFGRLCCATVDRQEACTLTVDHAKVSLIIPELAFETSKMEVSVNLLRAENERPKISSRETLLSPIVQIDCGYSDARYTLCKPCVLSIPHCAVLAAGDRQCNWRFSVYRCDNLDSHQDFYEWKPVVTIDQDGTVVSCNAAVSCHVDSQMCHIVTTKFGKYCLIGESAPMCSSVKSLRLAAFARKITSTPDHNVRVYAIEDHPDALEAVIEMECRLSSYLLDTPKHLLFVDSGDNLCLSVEHISSNWKSRTSGCYQEIPFHHIWNSRGILHCSFSFECGVRSGVNNEHFQCTIAVCQNNALAAREHLEIVQPSKGRSHSTERVIPSSQAMVHTPNNSNTSGVASCSCIDGAVVSQSHCAVAKQSRLLRLETRAKLCSLLDDCDEYRADWRVLGQQLGVQQCVLTMAASFVSPTSTLLSLFEAQARHNEQPIQTLYTLLRNLGRLDCALLLEAEMLTQVGRSLPC